MSSFSALFGLNKEANVDKSIDNLFKNNSGPISKDQLKSTRTHVNVPVRESKKEDEGDEEASESESESEEEEPVKKSKKSKKSKDADDDLEARYYDKLLKTKEEKTVEGEEKTGEENKVDEENKEESGSGSDSDSDSDSDAEEETTKTRTTKAKTIDLKEAELEKAERTIFVGNVVSTVISSKQVYKQFKKLFSQFGKVSSIRFRSISFDESLPRKVAFAKKNLHKSRDTLNSYVVYKEKESSLKALSKLNATTFENFHLRVDHVAHPAPKDTRKTVFVGNLDFEEKEESLWRYFNLKTDNDVESVRVIRDAKTNVGKGFALVQFKDSLSVNKVLLLNEKPMPSFGDDNKKARKIRISRAKAHSKPSLLSPNHIDNTKKKNVRPNLSEKQKTKLGRASTVLGKADRATAGKSKKFIEGQRATKGSAIAGIKGLKGAKVKKPRIRDRSTKFKNERNAISKEMSQ